MPFPPALRISAKLLVVGLLSFLFASCSVALAQPLVDVVQSAGVNWSAIMSGVSTLGSLAMGGVALHLGRRDRRRDGEREILDRMERRQGLMSRNIVKMNHNMTQGRLWTLSGLQTVGARIGQVERDHKRKGCYEEDGRDVGPFDFGEPEFEKLEEDTLQ